MNGAAQRLRAARRRLAESGEDRHYLNCLVGVPPEGRRLWRGVLEDCRKVLAARPGDPGALRLSGRALAFLGRDPAALGALARAVAAAPDSPEGWAWRGEAHLLAGRREAAREDFDRAVALDRDWAWGRLLRAVCLLTLGDCDGAEADLRAAQRSPAARSSAVAVAALMEGQRGEALKGIKALDGVIKSGPSGLHFAVRALLRRDRRDLPGCLEDLNSAVEREPSAWVYAQRADALNRSGFFQGALEDLDRVARLLPASAEPHAQAANVLFDQAFYPEALERLNRALARSPNDPHLLSRRARFYLVLNRLREAEADLRRVERLDPSLSQARFERLQVQALRNRFDQVLREVAAGAVAPPYDDYLRGYVDCRRGEHARARESFLKAAAGSDGGLAERLRFYALVCQVLAEPPGKAERPPRTQFYLCGIGIHHPFQVTVEILRALSRCDVLYNNLGDPQVSEFLGLFRGEVRAVARVFGEPAMGRVRRILAGPRPGRATGFVTRIHPFIYRRIANDLVTVCEQKGIRFRAFGAVSLTEVAWGLAEAAGAAARPRADGAGLRVFDIGFLNGNPDLLSESFGTVVYCIAGPQARRALCALLRRRYPAGHVAYILAGSGDREQEVVPAPVRDLEQQLLAVDLGAVLYVPPRGRRA